MYEYRVRPGYQSSKLMIDFFIKEADNLFFNMLFNVLSEINTSKLDVTDLWMNDEVIINCTSSVGDFLISKDIYDLVFIMAPNNQPAIHKIGQLLANSPSFSEQNFDASEYS